MPKKGANMSFTETKKGRLQLLRAVLRALGTLTKGVETMPDGQAPLGLPRWAEIAILVAFETLLAGFAGVLLWCAGEMKGEATFAYVAAGILAAVAIWKLVDAVRIIKGGK